MQKVSVDLENHISQNIILPDKITKKSNEFTTFSDMHHSWFLFYKKTIEMAQSHPLPT